MQQLVYEIQQKYKKLNVIANCAGTSCKQPFYNFTENRPIRFEDYQDAIQVILVVMCNVQCTYKVPTPKTNKLSFILFLFSLDECNRYIQCVSDCGWINVPTRI